MESLSLVTNEAKKKVASLLGKNSSSLFVCFCRVLYAKKDGKWKDDNLMGFLSIVVTRGIVKNFPVYSILLFDYNSFNLQLCVELYDHMEEPIKSSELCYIIPHHDLSFCLLFTNEDDAFIFKTGMRGVCQSLQRDSRPVVVNSPASLKKRKNWFSFLKHDKQQELVEHSYHISNVMTIVHSKNEGLTCEETSVLERLNDMSALSRFSYSSEKKLVDFSPSGDTREMIGSNKKEEERRKAEEEERKAEEERRAEERRREEERRNEEERRRAEEERRAEERRREEERRRAEEERNRAEEEERRKEEERAIEQKAVEERRKTEQPSEEKGEIIRSIEEIKPKHIVQQEKQGYSEVRPSSKSPPPHIPPPIIGHVRRKRRSLAPPIPTSPSSPKTNLRDSIKFDAIPEFVANGTISDPQSRASFPLPESFSVPATSHHTRLSLPNNVGSLPPPPPPPPPLPGKNKPHSPPPSSRLSHPMSVKAKVKSPSSRISFPLPNKAAPPPPSSRIIFPLPNKVAPPLPSSRESFPVPDLLCISPSSSSESSPVPEQLNPLPSPGQSFPIPEPIDLPPYSPGQSFPIPEPIDLPPSSPGQSFPIPEPMDLPPSSPGQSFLIPEPIDLPPYSPGQSFPIPEPIDLPPSLPGQSFPIPEPIDLPPPPTEESHAVSIQLEQLVPEAPTSSATPLSQGTSPVPSSSPTSIVPSGVRAIKKKEKRGIPSGVEGIPRPCVTRTRSNRRVVATDIPKEDDVDDIILDCELTDSSLITPTLAIPKIVFHRKV